VFVVGDGANPNRRRRFDKDAEQAKPVKAPQKFPPALPRQAFAAARTSSREYSNC